MERLAAIYVRKSSDESQQNASLESQVKACIRYAENNGFTVYEDVVFEENASGTTIEREKLTKLRKLVRSKQIDAVIVYSSDRLSRNPTDADVLLREYFSHGVELHLTTHGLLTDTPETWLIWGIHAQFNKYWRDKIIEATTRGKHAKMQRGIPIGSGRMLYGYKLAGSKNNEYLEVIEDQAAIIRSVFHHLVNERRSPIEIAAMFNELHIPTRSMKGGSLLAVRWTERMIYQIVGETAYGLGYYYINTGAGKDKKPESEHIKVESPVIVDREIWDEAQRIMEHGRQQHARHGKNQYLISKRTRCRHCGYTVNGKPGKNKNGDVYLRYQCVMREKRMFIHYHNGEKCILPSVSTSKIDNKVADWIITLMRNPQAILSAYKQAQKEVDNDMQDALTTLTQYEDTIASYKQQLTRYSELYAEGDITKDIFREKKRLLDGKVAEAQEKLAEYEETLNQSRITDAEIQTAVRYAEMVNKRLAAGKEVDHDTVKQIIDDLDMRFEMAHEESGIVVYIVWTIYEYRLPIGQSGDRVESDTSTR